MSVNYLKKMETFRYTSRLNRAVVHLQLSGATHNETRSRPSPPGRHESGTDQVDGHEPDAIAAAGRRPVAAPHAVLATTTKGRGVSVMEDKVEWHYLPLSRELYEQAVGEVRSAAGLPPAAAG